MHAQDLDEQDGKIKPLAQAAHKFWIAMCGDVLDHEVVGMDVRPPSPADKSRHSQSPTLIWLWMLREAAHKERKRLIAGQMIKLRRGQLAVSERYLAEKANWGRKAVRLFLSRLEAFDMITLGGSQDVDQLHLNFGARKLNGIQKGPPLTVVTICNYDKYQHDPAARGPARAQQGPSRGPAGAQNLTSNTPIQEDPPLPPKGGERPSYWQQALNPGALGDIQFVDGGLKLLNGTYQRWLDEFGGNDKKLDLAIKEIRVQPHGSEAIASQVERKLSRICREAMDRDERYAAAVRVSQAKQNAPKKLSRW